MAVGIPTDERLKNRRSHLKNQCDKTNLRESEAETFLQQRIHGRNDRLNHIIQQMAKAYREQDGISCALLNVRMPFDFSQYTHNSTK